MSVRSLMYCHDSDLIEKFTAALRVLGITNEPVIEFNRAVNRLFDRFDAVVVDCNDDSGLELIKQVRLSHLNARAIVFAVTDTERSRNIGSLANFQIPKPVNWDMTKRTLRAARTLIHRERRLSERSQMRSSALIMIDAKEIAVRMLDLSLRGMLVQYSGKLELNRRVMIRFHLPDTKIAISCKGRVAWSDERGQMGLEFLNLSQDTCVQMQNWLDGHRNPRRGAPVLPSRI
jgi:hypothetical protein